jgi:hypothetical protein
MTLAPIDWMMGRHPESTRRERPTGARRVLGGRPIVASAPKLFSKEA